MNIIKKLNNIKTTISIYCWKIDCWFKDNSPIYINLNIFKCLSLYIKAMFVFKSPAIVHYKIKEGDYFGTDYMYVPYEVSNKLYIDCGELGWKSKYGEFRHESNPYICFIWKNKVRHLWGFECPILNIRKNKETNKYYSSRFNLIYWEAMMDYVWETHNIVETFYNNIWSGFNDSDAHTIINMVRKHSKNKILKRIQNEKI